MSSSLPIRCRRCSAGWPRYRKTGGNPFFVTEVLSSGEARIPPTVRDAVLARVSRAGRAGRRLLEAVAIVPSPVEPWLLDVLAGDDVSRFEEYPEVTNYDGSWTEYGSLVGALVEMG
jgi:hypothetical protein